MRCPEELEPRVRINRSPLDHSVYVNNQSDKITLPAVQVISIYIIIMQNVQPGLGSNREMRLREADIQASFLLPVDAT
jgi:hypothetical protein